jgi:hypothetical protein
MNARQRVRAQLRLSGRITRILTDNPQSRTRPATLRVGLTGVTLHEFTTNPRAANPDAVDPITVNPSDYRSARPDPLYAGAAGHLQHLSARHPEAIEVLSRLCGREALIGTTRILPISLDRYGIVLRIERIRDHQDVRLPFSRPIATAGEVALEMRHLLALGARQRMCGR